MQVKKKKRGKKHFAMNLHIQGRICTRSSCTTAVVLQMIIFFCQWWHISEEQLITTVEKKILSSDQLSLRLPRRHAEPSSEKQHCSSSKEVVGFTGHDEHQTEPQENGGGGVLFLLSPPNQPRKNL